VSIFKAIIIGAILVSSSAHPHREAAEDLHHGDVAGDVHPILSLEEHCLIGAIVRGRWLEADEAAPLIKGGEKYLAYKLDRPLGEATGGKAESGQDCSSSKNIKLSPKIDGVIAIGNPGWNPLPRVPQSLSTAETVYREAVAAILKRNGIRSPKIKIGKVLRVDLDGNGVDEVVVSATHYAEKTEERGITPNPLAGDYSLVFIRKLTRGRVRTIIVEAEYHPKAGRQESEGPPNEFDVQAIVDVNGDGRMEIIVRGGYYEGSWATVYRLTGNKAESVLGCGCGA
jgi:uncharacterized protein YwbE